MTTNPAKQKLIEELKTAAFSQKTPLWKRLAMDLEKSNRASRIVNLSRINAHTKDGETIVIPGKVLAGGMLDHKVNVAAITFSNAAAEAIKAANGSIMTINELLKDGAKGKKIRIIG